MRVVLSLAVLALATLAASESSGAPFGGDTAVSVPVTPISTDAYLVASPDLLSRQGAERVHGAVCRISPTSTSAPTGVRIEDVGPDGSVKNSAVVRLSRNLTGREGGCAFYDRSIDWRLSSAHQIRICLDTDKPCRPG